MSITQEHNLSTADYQGPFNGIIVKTWIGDRAADGLEFAPASEVTYDVLVNLPGNPIIMRKMRPNHRRAVLGADIEPAQPDDECIACLRGNEIRLFIQEGIPTGDCAT